MFGVGILQLGEVATVGGSVSWETALNPEAILDCSPQVHASLCTRFKLNSAPMTNAEFASFVNRLEIRNGTLHKEGVRYGAATYLKRESHEIPTGSFINLDQPFSASVNLSDPLKGSLYQEYRLDRWLGIRGVLPSTFPEWRGISYPDGVVFGEGVRHGLGQGIKMFARMYYVAKGVERFVLVPRCMTNQLHNLLRTYLRQQGCPEEPLQCPTFINHFDFFFDEDFLVQRFSAKAFDVVGGQGVLIQAGVYAQVETKSVGLTLFSNCISRKWLELNPLGGCTDVDQEITAADIFKIQKAAVHAKEYAAAMIRLTPFPLPRQVPIPVDPTQQASANDQPGPSRAEN